MATSEGKADTKQEAKATESKEAEENQEPPLKYKAWVLKVSIHCEACKRKVEKTLRKIDGVYEAIADLRQQKATVKANLHVDVETLIKKLIKKGRHAELWPEKAGQKEKKQGKSKNKDKQSGQANGDQEGNSNRGGDKEKEAVKAESTVQQDTAKSCENGSTAKNAEGCNNVSKAHEGGSAPCKTGGQVKESKPDQVKQTVILAAGNQSPVAERKGGGGGGDSEGNAGEKSGGGGGGSSGSKKNKKKGQKGNANANANLDEGEHSGDAGPAFIGSRLPVYGPHGPVPMPSPASYSPPRHHQMYEYPTYSHAPPVYVTSYNTAYPSSSYSAAYYASSPYSYAYMHPGPMSERPPSDQGIYPYYSSQPSDSFEMFSDENPNACSIM